MCFLPLIIASFCSIAVAQNNSISGSEQFPQTQIATFQSGVNLVLVPVVVRDKEGHAVNGLTKDDFEVFDKGKRQNLASFSVIQRYQNTALSASSSKQETTASGGASSPVPKGTYASPNAPKTDAEARRNIIYLFDDIDAGFADFASVRAAMISHIRSLESTDYAAIYAFSGRPQADFTTNRDESEKIAMKLRMSLADTTADDAKACPDINYYLADLIINKNDQSARKAAIGHTVACEHVPEPAAEGIMRAAALRQLSFVPQQTRMALRMVRLSIARLSEMPGERVIVLSSPGFFQTPENDNDLEYVLRLAAQAHVTINALNIRGLYSNRPDASEHKDNSEAWLRYRLESFQTAEDLMRDVTQSTGGLFIHNYDGYRQAFDRLTAAPECSYILGFVSSHSSKPDGSFHPLKVRLVNKKGLAIQARRGYYVLEGNLTKQSARMEVDDAVFSHDEKHDLPVIVQTGYVEPNKGDPTITAIVKVNVDSLLFHVANQRNVDTLTVVAAVFTEDGSYIAGISKTVNLQLQDKTLKTAPAVSLPFAFRVKRGAYLIRLVLRDLQSGAMTTITRPEKIS